MPPTMTYRCVACGLVREIPGAAAAAGSWRLCKVCDAKGWSLVLQSRFGDPVVPTLIAPSGAIVKQRN